MQCIFNFDGGDVFSAGNNDVLAAILDLDVAVRVHHGKVACVKPAACKGLFGCRRIFKVALHDHIAAKEYFPHGLAIGRHRQQGLRVQHRDSLLQGIGHALATIEAGALLYRKIGPGFLLGADGGRPIDFGQAIDMREVDADGLAAFDHGRWRWGTGNQAVDLVVDAFTHSRRRMDQHAVKNWRAA